MGRPSHRGQVAAGLEHRDRVFDQDGGRRNHVVHGLAALLGGDRLVLIGEQHVALALGEAHHHFLQLILGHLPVPDQDARLRHQPGVETVEVAHLSA